MCSVLVVEGPGYPGRMNAHRTDGAAGTLSTGDLVKKLSQDTSRLVRDEIRLARLEMLDTLGNAKRGAGLFGGAGLMAFYAGAALVATVILALAIALPAWASALITAGLLFLLAGVLALLGRARFRRAAPPVPQEAAAGFKRDIDTIRERMHR